MKPSFFSAYLKSRAKLFGAFASFAFIFTLVSLLYRLPAEPVGYSLLLTAVLALLFAGTDCYTYYQKHRRLSETLSTLEAGLDSLPSPRGLVEEDYQKLLSALLERSRELSSQMDGRLSEMTDYYTLWAHQIKTPIAAMRLLLQEEIPADVQEELEQQLFQIEQYVEMVLHYLRLESISSDLFLCECDLAGMVRQAIKKYSIVFIHKKIQVKLENLEGKVLTDEKWLTFVLEQLLSNALKYTPPGGIISIFLEPGQPRTLVIRDTGIGIRAEDIPRIFERGFTGYNGRMDQKSTGIGLYLCRKILKKLHHTIAITSQPGRGATVRLGLSRDKLEPI